MGKEIPSDKRPLDAVVTLAREQPTQLMAQLRAVWPQVQQALRSGHTLRQVHKRLNLAGVPISYKVLVVYRGRIERGKKRRTTPVSPDPPSAAKSPESTPPFDPLANFRAQEQKRVAWQYPSGPPDESKLIRGTGFKYVRVQCCLSDREQRSDSPGYSQMGQVPMSCEMLQHAATGNTA
jgi:hypothetical protein